MKNIIAYKITREINLNEITLAEKLKEFQYMDDENALLKTGWCNVDDRIGDSVLYKIGDNLIMRKKTGSKIIPAPVIKENVKKKEAELLESRKYEYITKQMRKTIKDEVVAELCKTAFTKYSYTYVIINEKSGRVLVTESSINKAESALSLLRKTIGSLPIAPMFCNVETDLTAMVLFTNELPKNITLADSLEMKTLLGGSGKIKCSNEDIFSDNVKKHLDSHFVSKLAVNYYDALTLSINADGRLTFSALSQMTKFI